VIQKQGLRRPFGQQYWQKVFDSHSSSALDKLQLKNKKETKSQKDHFNLEREREKDRRSK
jgi:hypothetical protein